MPIEDWTAILSRAFNRLHHAMEDHHPLHINAYAATSPAEFFAVSSEYFFTAPGTLNRYYPELYCQLKAYYRQHTLERFRVA